MLTVTVDDLWSWEPCAKWTPARVNRIIRKYGAGQESWDVYDILNLEEVEHLDRMWLILRPEVLPIDVLHELSWRFTEHILPFWKIDDNLPYEVVEFKKHGEGRCAGILRDRIAAYELPDPWDAILRMAWYTLIKHPCSSVYSIAREAVWVTEHLVPGGSDYEERWQREVIDECLSRMLQQGHVTGVSSVLPQ